MVQKCTEALQKASWMMSATMNYEVIFSTLLGNKSKLFVVPRDF